MTQVFPRPFKERFIEGAITFGVIAAFIVIVVGGCSWLAIWLNEGAAEHKCERAHVTHELISRCMSDGRCTYTPTDLLDKEQAFEVMVQCAYDELNQVDGPRRFDPRPITPLD